MTDQGEAENGDRGPNRSRRPSSDMTDCHYSEARMAEFLGAESELTPSEIDLLLKEAELEAGELSDLQHIVQVFDSIGVIEELASQPPTAEERAEASERWIALGQEMSDTTGEAHAHGTIPGDRPRAWWRRTPTLVVAAAAVLLAIFIGGQRPASPDGHGEDVPEFRPGGHLGASSDAPELRPTLSRDDDGNWVVALDPIPPNLLASKNDLMLDVEIRAENGSWSSIDVRPPTLDLGRIHWTWPREIESEDATLEDLRYRVRAQAPAGRRAWTSHWFRGQDSLIQ